MRPTRFGTGRFGLPTARDARGVGLEQAEEAHHYEEPHRPTRPERDQALRGADRVLLVPRHKLGAALGAWRAVAVVETFNIIYIGVPHTFMVY